jgi:hypothetical protein
MQVIRNQFFRDEKLITLVATMESIFSFVDVIQSDIFIQTVECGIFIREYANRGFVGKCV